jgi:Na+/H+ antiporter NhaC
MHPAISGAITGVIVAVLLFLFDYMMLRRSAAERAQKNHKTRVEFDQTERSRVASLVRFIVFLPVLFGIGNWMLSKV